MAIAGPTTNHAEIRHWADSHKAVPTEILPPTLDHEPTTLRIMLPKMAAERIDVRVMSWDEFFIKFDLFGLSFVYDDETGGYNELLQIEAESPYRNSNQIPTQRPN